MSIRSKILAPMVIISVLAASTILLSNIMQFSSFVDRYTEEELMRASLKLLDEIEGMQMTARTATLYCANDNTLIAAMERGDQEAVLARAKELFAETNVETLSIVDTSAIVLARGHTPELYGDDVSNLPAVRTTLAGTSGLGVERGISTSLSLRATAPIYDSQGRLLGALFAGYRLDTDQFADRLHSLTGCEIAVFVDDVRVSTTLYREDGTRATGSLVPDYIENALLAGDAITNLSTFQDREILVRHTPVLSNNGEVAGVISVGTYLAEKQSMMESFILTGTLISIAFIISSILIILFVSRQIATPIDQKIDRIHYDGLTGIYNRHFFEERLHLLLKLLSRSGGAVSLLMIDIDCFKEYNDTYGHVKGDECLKTVAAILSQSLSRADDFVARYGGEEFVAVLPNTDEAGARIIADKMLEGIRRCAIPHEKSRVANHITISIGATTGRANQVLGGTDFVDHADSMLYASKQNGRDQYSFTRM